MMSVRPIQDEFSRVSPIAVVELLPGEKRGYWKYHAPEKWFRQAKIQGKLDNHPATLLLDTGAEVSIVDTAFAREVGCHIDTDRTQDCVGIRNETYQTVGRTRLKVTLAGNLVYFFEAWVGELSGQHAILGMDFMVPAGVRLDTSDGSICLPDEVRVRMVGRRALYGAKTRWVVPDQPLRIAVGQDRDVRLYDNKKDAQQLWVTRGEHWVSTVVNGRAGRPSYLRVTNVGCVPLVLDINTKLGMWMSGAQLPREFGFVRTGSLRYQEWQNLAYGATTDAPDPTNVEEDSTPMVERPTYPAPKGILRRPHSAPRPVITVVRAKSSNEVESAEGNAPREQSNSFDATETPSHPGEDAAAKSSGRSEVADPLRPAPAIAGSDPPVSSRSPEAATEPAEGADETEDEVYYHEGSDLFAEELEREMAMLPELSLTAEVKIEDLKVGRPIATSPEIALEQEERLRRIIWRRRKLLIGKGNALPPAAVGTVCDIDVGNAKPIAQRVRKIRPQFREKVAELLKGLLSAGIIQPSTSLWASPIVVIIKKNGVDIRLCIDYRLVNGLTQLMVYPMPLINDLLEDLDAFLWFCSLDMASGFWVVPMTDRARLISAFITPLGLFEWLRMPFGLKNAPQIYQRLVDNVLYGFRRLPRLATQDVFTEGETDAVHDPSVLGRRSYIDDILVGASSWDDLCAKVERLLDACERWNLSISVEKSYWGMAEVEYLGHLVSHDGLSAKPKNLESLATLEFPRTLKALQSFLGSLNYYHRFLPDFAIYATVLYALTEGDFERNKVAPETRSEDKWTHAVAAFGALKAKIAETPMLRHYDPEREPVVLLYASDWAVSAVLTQEHEGTFMPVKFTSRTLKPNELNYDPVEKEILSLLRLLNNCFTMLAGRAIRVLSRRTTLAWLFRSHKLEGRLSQWAAMLSPWKLTIEKSNRGEADILGALAASVTPRSDVDATLESIAPRKRPTKITTIPRPQVAENEELHVLSFDGSAKAKREGGAFGAIIWKLPGWDVVKAASGYDLDLTVNEAEYRGLLLGCTMLRDVEVQRLVVCGDSNLAIRQLREEMDCKSPGLMLLRGRAWKELAVWPKREYVHVRRDWNASADLLAGQALQRQAGVEVKSLEDIQDLMTLNRLPEVVSSGGPATTDEGAGTADQEANTIQIARSTDMEGDPIQIVRSTNEESVAIQIVYSTAGDTVTRSDQADYRRVAAVATRSATAQASIPLERPAVLQESVVQQLRLERIRVAQDEEQWMLNLKLYLRGDVGQLSRKEAKDCSKLAYQYEEGEGGLLYYFSRGDEGAEDRNAILKLVVPETLRQDVLHHFHASLEGAHQGIGRTYQRIRQHFHWPGLFKSVQRYVGECTDCETGKGRPTIRGESPGNIVATYPFQVVAMDHIPSLPVSYKGNTELLVWVDLFTGFTIVKANASRTAETIAEAYEEAVFRRFGASEAIRHDREPGFMSDFFRAFNRLMGQRQRATLAYRPQANGAAERMVQTVTRAIKMYIADVDQRDWDEYAERLTFALNTAQDRTRNETPFYLVHGWDPRTTLEAALPMGNTRRQDADARRWRMGIQRHYRTARAQAVELIQTAVATRAQLQNENATDHQIEQNSQVWLYLDRVKPGYARKLAHLWHGPFRVEEMVNRYVAKLTTEGTPYHLYPLVHVSKLKLVRRFPSRPVTQLVDSSNERFDFDEELLPEDSWNSGEMGDGIFEVERILDMREGRATRFGRVLRDFKVKWKGYDETAWVSEADLNCGGLLYDFLRVRAGQNRFQVMQSHEEGEIAGAGPGG